MILKLLEKVCKSIEKQGIPYMLSGSLAMNTYTVPRMTRDIDIIIGLKSSEVDKFAEIFKEGFYIYKEGIRDEVKRRGMFNVIDYESGHKIDFIVRKNSEFHINEFERRKKTGAFGFDLWIVSIEDLIISKLQWIQDIQSDTQLNDIKNLLENPIVDKEYLTEWIKKLNLDTFNLIFDA